MLVKMVNLVTPEFKIFNLIRGDYMSTIDHVRSNVHDNEQVISSLSSKSTNITNKFILKECLEFQSTLASHLHDEYLEEISMLMGDISHIFSQIGAANYKEEWESLFMIFGYFMESWATFHTVMKGNTASVFAEIFNKNKDQFRYKETENSIQTWYETKPAFYNVEEVANVSTLLSEINSNKYYHVYHLNTSPPKKGSKLLAMLVPVGENYVFYTHPLPIPSENFDDLMAHLEHGRAFFRPPSHSYQTIKEFLIHDFPAAATVIFQWFTDPFFNQLHFSWPDKSATQVVKLIDSYQLKYRSHQQYNMIEKTLFKHYYEKVSPNIQSPQSYAAATIFLANKRIHQEDPSLTIEDVCRQLDANLFQVLHLSQKIEELIGGKLDELSNFVNEDSDYYTFDPEDDDDYEANWPFSYVIDPLYVDGPEEGTFFTSIYNFEKSLKETSSKTEELLELKAAAIIYHALEKSNDEKISAIIEALSIAPKCIEAYSLAGDIAPDFQTALSCYERAISIGEKRLPKKKESDRWRTGNGKFYNRPFLRAKVSLARLFRQTGNEQEAVANYMDVVFFIDVHKDPLNCRYELQTYLFEIENYNELKKVLYAFRNDLACMTYYNEALLEFIQHGRTENLTHLLHSSIRFNKKVIECLKSDDDLSDLQFLYLETGEYNEALHYAKECKHLWQQYPELLSLAEDVQADIEAMDKHERSKTDKR